MPDSYWRKLWRYARPEGERSAAIEGPASGALGARPAFEPGRRVPQAMRTGSPTQARCRLTRRVACRSGGRPRTAVR
ncbi:hypothetical protein WL22_15920 [Burkholderia ubonensis]|nr:hypothetical protein WL22_15920 [Burkholderia ubonensis]